MAFTRFEPQNLDIFQNNWEGIAGIFTSLILLKLQWIWLKSTTIRKNNNKMESPKDILTKFCPNSISSFLCKQKAQRQKDS
jgi:hypothetical protein